MSQALADLGAATTQFPVPSGALLLLSTHSMAMDFAGAARAQPADPRG
jgi:hypothetical protein